ncbi:MAG: helix-turn-helix transcriptional regulator, partial [Psychroflexus sp.]|nr:helix-turn-helix transcriptional regulator [Psychroflexus sp.]
ILFSVKAKEVKFKENTLYRWVFYFVMMQTLFYTSLVVTSFVSFFFMPNLGDELIANISFMFTVSFFFALSIHLFWNQNILRKLKYFSHIADETIVNNSAFKDLQHITSLVYREKIFTEPENNIDGISKKIGISKSELSTLINTEYSSFSTWINDIKIDYSIELIQNSYLKNHSVVALAQECGFKSKNTFYRAFKRKTGLTPIAFLNNLKITANINQKKLP